LGLSDFVGERFGFLRFFGVSFQVDEGFPEPSGIFIYKVYASLSVGVEDVVGRAVGFVRGVFDILGFVVDLITGVITAGSGVVGQVLGGGAPKVPLVEEVVGNESVGDLAGVQRERAVDGFVLGMIWTVGVLLVLVLGFVSDVLRRRRRFGWLAQFGLFGFGVFVVFGAGWVSWLLFQGSEFKWALGGVIVGLVIVALLVFALIVDVFRNS